MKRQKSSIKMKTSQETDEIMALLAKILANGGTSLDVINNTV
jgi:hypothetical protein